MVKLEQSGAILIISLLIFTAYYIFDQQDLISVTEVTQFKCLDSPSMKPYVCISCINRSQFQVAKQSSIYIKDPLNQFRVMTIPKEGFLTCEQLLQFVSYDIPIKNTKDIKFQDIGPAKQILEMLDIQITKEAVNKFQVHKQIQSVAVFQMKQNKSADSTIVTYSTQDSELMARQYGKILSQFSIVLSIFSFLFYKFQQDDFKVGFLCTVVIGLMVLGQTMLSNAQYLINYAMTLSVGYYLTKSLVSRLLVAISIIVSFGIDVVFPKFYYEYLAIILVLYILVGSNKSFKKIGTLGIFCFLAMILCISFRQHHHWLSLPLRKIIQYTILLVSPLLMEIVSSSAIDESYNKIPSGSTEQGQSTVSLPGFEQEEASDSDEQES